MPRHGAVAALGDHQRRFHQFEALGLQRRQNTLEHRQGRRLRVADHHHRALLARQLQAALHLLHHCGFARVVIEEYVPREAGEADLLRLGGGYGGSAGAAVEEEQMAALQLRGQPGHGRAVGRHAAAFVVVQALHIGDLCQRGVQTPSSFVLGQLRAPGEVTAGRVHRHVQHHGAPALVRLARKLGGVGRVGDDRQGDGGGYVEHLAVARQILPEVVDDDADQRLAAIRPGRGGHRQAQQRTQAQAQ